MYSALPPPASAAPPGRSPPRRHLLPLLPPHPPPPGPRALPPHPYHPIPTLVQSPSKASLNPSPNLSGLSAHWSQRRSGGVTIYQRPSGRGQAGLGQWRRGAGQGRSRRGRGGAGWGGRDCDASGAHPRGGWGRGGGYKTRGGARAAAEGAKLWPGAQRALYGDAGPGRRAV